MALLYTVGHSTRSWEEFLACLEAYHVEGVVDIRRFPSSKRFPWFNREALEKKLREKGIEYVWLEVLGGYRKKGLGTLSPHKCLKGKGFQKYADHMTSQEFEHAMKKVFRLAGKKRIALLCAERFYWKCHRRLVADYVLANGFQVEHILERKQSQKHFLAREARIKNGKVYYDREKEKKR
jgi:uncharacterized protein (DUF488 family)